MSLIRNLLNEVRFFLKGDPYHRTVDNRPLTDLDTNISAITDASDALATSQNVLSTAIGSVLRGYARNNSAVGVLQYNSNLTITVLRAIASMADSVTTNTHAVDITKLALATAPQVLTFSNTSIPLGYSRPYSVQAQWSTENATIPWFDPADPDTTTQYKTLFPDVNQIKVLTFVVVAGSDQVTGPSYTYPSVPPGYIEVFRVVVEHGQTVLTSADVTLTGWWEEGGGVDDDPFLTLARAYANGIDRDLALVGNALGATDLDTATTVGEYSFSGADLTQNRPFLGGTLVVRQKGTSRTQAAYSSSTSDVAFRAYTGSVWTDWRYVSGPDTGGVSDTYLYAAVGTVSHSETIPATALSLTALCIGCGGSGGAKGSGDSGSGGGGGHGAVAVLTLSGALGGLIAKVEIGTPDPAPVATTALWPATSTPPNYTAHLSGVASPYAGNPIIPGDSTCSYFTLMDASSNPLLRLVIPAGENGGDGSQELGGGFQSNGGVGGKTSLAYVDICSLPAGITYSLSRPDPWMDYPATALMGEYTARFTGAPGEYRVVAQSVMDEAGDTYRTRLSKVIRMRTTQDSTGESLPEYNVWPTAGIMSNPAYSVPINLDICSFTGPYALSRGGPGGYNMSRQGEYVSSQGNWDVQAEAFSYPTTGSGGGGSVVAGDYWLITNAGRMGRFWYPTDYNLIAAINDPGQDSDSWGHSSLGSAVILTPKLVNQFADIFEMSLTAFPDYLGAGGSGCHYSQSGPGGILDATAGGSGAMALVWGKKSA